MYGKEEASKLRQQFWITFGKYMKPIPSAEGFPVNWVNYKTGVKHIYFRMDAGQYETKIAIEITHPDADVRKYYFHQFLAFKTLLVEALGEDWTWEENTVNSFGISLSRISKMMSNVNVYDQQCWPAMISFLKPRIIALDQFWSDAKPAFETF